MPSPVIGSTTPAASPTKSARGSAVSAASLHAAGIGHARCGPSGSASIAEDPAHARAREDVAPQRRELLAAGDVVAEHAEADVGAAAADREHPRVAREEVALEEHPEAGVVDAAEVLAERVPRAEVGDVGGLRVRAVAGWRSSGRRRRRATARRTAVPSSRVASTASGVVVTELQADTVADFDAPTARQQHERGIELAARHHSGVLAVVGQRERRPHARRARR